MRIFYGAGHEQFTPSELLPMPGSPRTRDSTESLAATTSSRGGSRASRGMRGPGSARPARRRRSVAIGTAVTPAVARYHPALVAQAFATLEELFPGRVFLGVGSGESLNESPVGCDWPDGETQLEMMEEALDVIRRLWAGETLDGGRHFPMKAARLHTRPEIAAAALRLGVPRGCGQSRPRGTATGCGASATRKSRPT